jgi:hypothetical protein
VPVPADVLALLSKVEMVKNISEDQNLPADKLPQSWFSASVIYLATNSKSDLVVEGEPPLAGGNTVPFWVFCATDRGFELVLTASAHDLEVKKTRWKGLRVIVMSAESAAVFTEVEFR